MSSTYLSLIIIFYPPLLFSPPSLPVSLSPTLPPSVPSSPPLPSHDTGKSGLEKTVVLKHGRDGYGFDLSKETPVFVLHVNPSSSAEKAGINPGDRLMKVHVHMYCKFLLWKNLIYVACMTIHLTSTCTFLLTFFLDIRHS